MTEREKFEVEYRKRSDRDDDDVEESLRLGKDGEYIYDGTWTAFYWWQAASATPQIPEGMALVPVEPNQAMLEAGVSVALSTSIHGQGGWNAYLSKLYAAMLAAAKENGE